MTINNDQPATSHKRIMHLDECFQQNSILSGILCITSDWALKSQTNFYIPTEAYAGYSYLFEEDESQHLEEEVMHGWNAFKSHHVHQHDVHFHGPHHRAFVHAMLPSSLHPHHMSYTTNVHRYHFAVDEHVTTTERPMYNFSMPMNPGRDESMDCPIFASTGHRIHISASPITIPYMQPHLQMPVPPLQLPWYFGVLCFSFSLGGIASLYFTPQWVLYGGGKKIGVDDMNIDEYQRHWYPYRTFAWLLMVIQVRFGLLI